MIKLQTDLQVILQHFNAKFNPYTIIDITTKKKKVKQTTNRKKQYVEALKQELAELNKYLGTWSSTNVVIPNEERESILRRVEILKKEIKSCEMK